MKTIAKKKRKVGCLILLVVLFSMVGGCAGVNIDRIRFGKPVVEFESEKGVQPLNHETPVFQDKSYKSSIMGYISPREIDVLEIQKGWRLIETEYGTYWIPPAGIVYDRDSSVLLDVPIASQFPEFPNGCEAVAALMMLNKYGADLDKADFVESIPKDDTPIEKVGDDVTVWGDPAKGFVGDVTGEEPGYSIYPKPLKNYLRKYVENPVDLTGFELETLERYVRAGNPVVVWTTVNFRTRESNETWVTPSGKMIRASFNMHAMTLAGFDEKYYYLNDPFTGTKNYRVSKHRFYEVWSSMGKKAVSIE